MKYLIVICFLIVSCKNQSDRIENELYNCLINSLSEKEKGKFKSIVKEYEEHLIQKGILESSAAHSYWNFYKRLGNAEVFDFSNDFRLSKKISFLNRENPKDNYGLIDCHNTVFKSEKYLKSNQYKLKQELQSLKKHRITPKITAQTTIDILTIEDFELEYNKLITLMFIDDLNKK